MSKLQNLAYCTIVAENYLPQAMTLFTSLHLNHPTNDFYILIIGEIPKQLKNEVPSKLHIVQLGDLPLTKTELSNLVSIYDVVELSTGLKPLFMMEILKRYEKVVYLDPDMYVLKPLNEVTELLDTQAVVLTPHLLLPIKPGTPFLSEINTLTVGVYNLGFCAVNQEGNDFLIWWWSHLERECLIYPLLGLFVDQKWVDIGSVFYNAYPLKHPGYNIGHWNLHERKFEKSSNGYTTVAGGKPVKLLHFSGFDPENPQAISSRQNESLEDRGLSFKALDEVSLEYAEIFLAFRQELNVISTYEFAKDSSGKNLTKRLRRTYRSALLTNPEVELPSPFNPEDKARFKKWRRNSIKLRVFNEIADISIALNYAMPSLASWVRRTFPGKAQKARSKILADSNIRR